MKAAGSLSLILTLAVLAESQEIDCDFSRYSGRNVLICDNDGIVTAQGANTPEREIPVDSSWNVSGVWGEGKSVTYYVFEDWGEEYYGIWKQYEMDLNTGESEYKGCFSESHSWGC